MLWKAAAAHKARYYSEDCRKRQSFLLVAALVILNKAQRSEGSQRQEQRYGDEINFGIAFEILRCFAPQDDKQGWCLVT